MEVLETQVIEMLTANLGRTPTQAEIELGLAAPWTLGNVGKTLTAAQSVLSIGPTEDIQTAIDKLESNGGGVLYLNPGTYVLDSDILIPTGIAIEGFLRDDTILDFNGTAHSIICFGEDAYTDGTISINDGDTEVVGSGTVWTDSMIGQTIWLDIGYYTIVARNSDTSIDIDFPYSGPNLSGSVYAIATPIQSLNISNITIQNSATHGIHVAYTIGGYIFSNFNVYNCGGAGILSEWSSYPNIDLASLDGNAINCDFYYTNGYGFTGTICSNAVTGDGLRLNNSGNATIFNCEMSNNAGSGISFIDSGAVSISSIAITGNGVDGLKYVSNVKKCQLVQANLEDNGAYGISIEDVSSEDNVIVANVFANNTSGEVNDLGTGTLIRSNIGVSDN